MDGDGKPDVVTNSIIFFQDEPVKLDREAFNDTYNGIALLDIGSGLGRINIVGNEPANPYRIVWFENPRERGGNARTGTWTRRIVGPGYGCPGGASECQTVATAATGDVNGDGRMDAVVGQAEGQSLGGAPLPGGLRWFEAPADRTQPWIRHDLDVEFESTHNIRLADINGDGTMDVVAGEQDQAPLKRMAVFYNDGHGDSHGRCSAPMRRTTSPSATPTATATSTSSPARTAGEARRIRCSFS